jgi:uncharacterized membrane-anchored protein YjiN (DUF445 family)
LKNNRHIATVILLLVTAGFLISFPMKHTFVGGLLTALFGASMVGGFADWFGITALFRKPLGIPFHTAIIPRNREKIFDSLVYMVENELLTKEAIAQKLERFNISEKLLSYLDEDGGTAELSLLIRHLAMDMLGRIDPLQAGDYLGRLLEDNSENIKLLPLFSNAVDWLSKNVNDERIISSTIEEIKEFILYPKFGLLVRDVVKDLFAELQKNAEKETAGKRLFFKLVLAFASFSDMSPLKLSARLLQEALEYFNLMKVPESIQRKGFEIWLEKTAEDFKSNPELSEKIESKGLDLLKRASLSTAFTDYVYPFLKSGSQMGKLQKLIDELVQKLLENFRNSSEEQAALDAYVKKSLSGMLDENHNYIGRMVRKKLDMFSNDMLVDLIEEKAGNDLQIIRINGSVVGGLVGLVIFLLTFWI